MRIMKTPKKTDTDKKKNLTNLSAYQEIDNLLKKQSKIQDLDNENILTIYYGNQKKPNDGL